MRAQPAPVVRAVAAGVVAVGVGGCSEEPVEPSSAVTAEAPTTQDLRFPVTDQTNVVWRRPLPVTGDGAWSITWSATLEGLADDASRARPLKAECYVVQGRSEAFADRTFYTADESAVVQGADALSFSGSGVVDLVDGAVVALECELNDGVARPVSWSTNPLEPVQVTVTPLAGHVRVE